MMCVCVIKLIGWKMDGWIGLSGCECGKWKVDCGCGCGKWKVARFRISQLYHFTSKTPQISKIKFNFVYYDIHKFFR